MASKIIEFDVAFNYADKEEGIYIPLVLNANGRTMMTVGFVDTGCGACLFSNEVGMDLGIDIESGELAIFKSGAGGSVPAYGHPIVLEFLGIAFESFVYLAKFMPSAGLCRVAFQPIRPPLILPTTSSRNQFENSNSQYEEPFSV